LIIRENADLKAHKQLIESKIKSLIHEKTESSVALLAVQDELRVVSAELVSLLVFPGFQ
jgi:hypothetical protein